MEGFHLQQLQYAVLIVLSTIFIALVRSERLAKAFEKTTIRWIKAVRRIQAEWRKPLPIEKPSQPPPP